MMRAEITNLPMFDEYAFIEQYGNELTSDELEVLSERIDDLDRHIIALNDTAIDMLHRAISDQAFEEGSVVAANLLELLAGMQRYVYRTREGECHGIFVLTDNSRPRRAITNITQTPCLPRPKVTSIPNALLKRTCSQTSSVRVPTPGRWACAT